MVKIPLIPEIVHKSATSRNRQSNLSCNPTRRTAPMRVLLKRILPLCLMVVMILSLIAGLAGCGNKKYNAVMYGNVYENRTWLNDEFYENNLTHGSFSSVTGDYVQDETYPTYRTKIIVEKAEFDTVFKEFPVEVDFEQSMIVMHCFTTSSSNPYKIKSIFFDEQALTINYKQLTSKKTVPNASMPISKWVIVKMDKLDIDSAEFIFGK